MDLGWRAWLQGYKVLYVPSAVMVHFMGGTAFAGQGMTPTVLFLVLRNSLYFMVKNFEGLTAFRGLVLFFLKTLYTLGYTLATGNGPAFFAVGQAYFCFMKDLGKAFQARALTQKQRKIKDRTLWKMGILAGVRDVLRATFSGLKDQKSHSSKGLYDTKDVMKLRVNKQGDRVFYQAS